MDPAKDVTTQAVGEEAQPGQPGLTRAASETVFTTMAVGEEAQGHPGGGRPPFVRYRTQAVGETPSGSVPRPRQPPVGAEGPEPEAPAGTLSAEELQRRAKELKKLRKKVRKEHEKLLAEMQAGPFLTRRPGEHQVGGPTDPFAPYVPAPAHYGWPDPRSPGLEGIPGLAPAPPPPWPYGKGARLPNPTTPALGEEAGFPVTTKAWGEEAGYSSPPWEHSPYYRRYPPQPESAGSPRARADALARTVWTALEEALELQERHGIEVFGPANAAGGAEAPGPEIERELPETVSGASMGRHNPIIETMRRLFGYAPGPGVTTLALGEESGGHGFTTLAVGEESQQPQLTTAAVGEESGTPAPAPDAGGEAAQGDPALGELGDAPPGVST